MIYLNSVLDSTQQKASENMHLTELPKKSWAPYSEHVVQCWWFYYQHTKKYNFGSTYIWVFSNGATPKKPTESEIKNNQK